MCVYFAAVPSRIFVHNHRLASDIETYIYVVQVYFILLDLLNNNDNTR